MTWLKLESENRVQEHATSAQEVANLRRLIERDLHDAVLPGLSPDRAFATAYNSVLQLSKLTIACAGYRISSTKAGHHQTTFEAVRLVLGARSHKLTDYFETCRRKRNFIDYDFANVASETQAKELIQKAQEFKTMVEGWIAKNHSKYKL